MMRPITTNLCPAIAALQARALRCPCHRAAHQAEAFHRMWARDGDLVSVAVITINVAGCKELFIPPAFEPACWSVCLHFRHAGDVPAGRLPGTENIILVAEWPADAFKGAARKARELLQGVGGELETLRHGASRLRLYRSLSGIERRIVLGRSE